jgi:hypothetical protein
VLLSPLSLSPRQNGAKYNLHKFPNSKIRNFSGSMRTSFAMLPVFSLVALTTSEVQHCCCVSVSDVLQLYSCSTTTGVCLDLGVVGVIRCLVTSLSSSQGDSLSISITTHTSS